ncbi:MAG TPA: DUF1287 domain-containing protein [Kofleriaceae bacterium]|nr:DUF1287 domain-containing protein [Kofleriaceae bacterium]
MIKAIALALGSLISLACEAHGDAQPVRQQAAATAAPPAPTSSPAPAEPSLGVSDKGIWSDLDPKVQLHLPADLARDRISARIDRDRKLLVLAIDGFPRKAYPLTGTQTLRIGPHELALRPGDRAELERLLAADRISETVAARDHDRDGLPDPLDVLIGAKKTVLNADAYTEGYIEMGYPNGDVPRNVGVCTDVIIRAVRNAGIDLQKELHEDIARAKAAYPMIKGRGNPVIDQRRVGTLLPYFKRHWQAHTSRLDDPSDPLRPGDVIFMDTFPNRSGPDHIGIISDTIGDSKLPLVINNWTNGTVTAEMDLLPSVPVLYRFRLPES